MLLTARGRPQAPPASSCQRLRRMRLVAGGSETSQRDDVKSLARIANALGRRGETIQTLWNDMKRRAHWRFLKGYGPA